MSEKLANTATPNAALARSRGGASPQNWLRPRYDTRELENGDYQLRVWMPGVPKEGVNVSLDRSELTVTGMTGRHWEDGWRPLMKELPEGDYRLSLTLNIRVDGERIGAHVENGVLVLDLPIVEAAKPREIAIE